MSALSAKTRLLACLIVALASHASAQPADDVVVTTHHINPVRDARTPWDELKNCLRDESCSAMLDTLASQVGLPKEGLALVRAGAAFSAKAEGEETRYSIAAMPGRKVCRVQIRTTSVVPATGDRASLFSLTATPEAVAIYTWTPRQGSGKGRSWYDGKVFVAHVKSGLQDSYIRNGKCSITAADKGAFACRGASGVNNGLAACGSKDL